MENTRQRSRPARSAVANTSSNSSSDGILYTSPAGVRFKNGIVTNIFRREIMKLVLFILVFGILVNVTLLQTFMVHKVPFWVARAKGESSDRIGGLSLEETEIFFAEKKQRTKISLVISYYETSLNWMGDYFGAQDGYQISDITIISKNPETDEILGLSAVEAIGESVEIVHLPNVGRCDHSYAYWIKERLPKLNKERDGDDVVMFLKDSNTYSHQDDLPRTFEEIFRTTVEYGFGCFAKPVYRTALMFHDRAVLESFWMKSYQRLDRDKTADTFKSKYSSLKDWRDQMGLTFPKADYVPVCYGGSFATKKRGLFSQTKRAWGNMEKNLSRGNNIEEGHFAERSWAPLVTYTSDDELIQSSAAFKPYIDHIFDVENRAFSCSGMVILQDCNTGSKKPCI